MESPHEAPHFRWVRRPSEEALLAHRPAGMRRPRATSPPPREPMPQPAPPPPFEPSRRKLQRRDLAITAAVVGAAVWFALHAAGTGIPFGRSGAEAPPPATDTASARLADDRGALAALPRPTAGPGEKAETTTRLGGSPSGGQGSSGSKHDDPEATSPPADEPSEPPLLEAAVPGVGSVTVEQPDLPLPDGTPTDTDLDDVGAVLSRTSNLSLP